MTPLVIAHRGDSAHAPENTLRSVRQAMAKEADWIEVDLQLSADDQIVVFHDEDLHRLTGQIGRVENLDLSEMTALHVSAAQHDPDDDTCVMALDTLLTEVGDRIPLYLELKSNGEGRDDPRNARLLEQCLERVAGTPHVLASFDLDLVRGALLAKTPAVLILDDVSWIDACTPAELRRMRAVSLRWDLIDAELVDALHVLGADVWCWTVDDPTEIVRLASNGVDGICSNDVAQARAAANEWSS